MRCNFVPKKVGLLKVKQLLSKSAYHVLEYIIFCPVSCGHWFDSKMQSRNWVFGKSSEESADMGKRAASD
jgi:hypothetical protein